MPHPPPPRSLWSSIREAKLFRVLAVYASASFVVLQVVALFMDRMGLPDWIFPTALILLLIGLPIIVATALVQSADGPVPEPSNPEAQQPMPPEREATGTEVGAVTKSWLTWRRAVLGGVIAFVSLAIFTGGYMALRALGIGPVGSLVAAGVLEQRERILVADFESRGDDPYMADAVTEAFRVDLAQSSIVTVVDPATVRGALVRMQRAGDQRVDLSLAREIAQREGIKAVIAGEITPAGSGYVLSARLVSAETGADLAAHRETAGDADAVIPAIDRLSHRLRERIGESLRTIRGSPPLDQVTTGSLEALRKYSQGLRAINLEGDSERGISLLEEAVALDTTFAMAYRKLGIEIGNRGDQATSLRYLEKAYQHRDRLSDVERYLTLGSYHFRRGDRERAITAYRTLLDLHPDYGPALNNLSILYRQIRQDSAAIELLQRSLKLPDANTLNYVNLLDALMADGRMAEADAVHHQFAARFPGNPDVLLWKANLEYVNGRWEAALATLREMEESTRSSPRRRWEVNVRYAAHAARQGRLDEAERFTEIAVQADVQRGWQDEALQLLLEHANRWSVAGGSPQRGVSTVEQALRRFPLSEISPQEAALAHGNVALSYAAAGRSEMARAHLRSMLAAPQPTDLTELRVAIETLLALSENRPRDALRLVEYFDRQGCRVCAYRSRGLAYEMLGQTDSALVSYESYLAEPAGRRVLWDALWLVPIHERLGELYERRGDRSMAIENYRRVAEVWANAEPALRPRAAAAQRKVVELRERTP